MNRVDQSDAFRASGRSLITDHPAHRPPVGPVGPEHQARKDEIDALLESAAIEPTSIVCLLSRHTSGLGVQALVVDGDTFITVTLNGECETFEVPGDRLLDAFEHPYTYGATLSL